MKIIDIDSVRKKNNFEDFLNWLQDKLEEEMQKPSYQNYVKETKPRKVTRR